MGEDANAEGAFDRFADRGGPPPSADRAASRLSSYVPEVRAISDRILIAKGGKIVEELRIADATEERIMYAADH